MWALQSVDVFAMFSLMKLLKKYPLDRPHRKCKKSRDLFYEISYLKNEDDNEDPVPYLLTKGQLCTDLGNGNVELL